MAITDFYNKTTKNITATITYNSANPDITSDTVTIYFKNIDTGSIGITKEADVTGGSSGAASFELDTTDTNVTSSRYHVFIKWVSATYGTFIFDEGDVMIWDNFT